MGKSTEFPSEPKTELENIALNCAEEPANSRDVLGISAARGFSGDLGVTSENRCTPRSLICSLFLLLLVSQ